MLRFWERSVATFTSIFMTCLFAPQYKHTHTNRANISFQINNNNKMCTDVIFNFACLIQFSFDIKSAFAVDGAAYHTFGDGSIVWVNSFFFFFSFSKEPNHWRKSMQQEKKASMQRRVKTDIIKNCTIQLYRMTFSTNSVDRYSQFIFSFMCSTSSGGGGGGGSGVTTASIPFFWKWWNLWNPMESHLVRVYRPSVLPEYPKFILADCQRKKKSYLK